MGNVLFDLNSNRALASTQRGGMERERWDGRNMGVSVAGFVDA